MRQSINRFWHASEGVTAIEFALVAPILFYFFFSAFEFGMIFTQRELLDRAVNNAIRQVYIGAATEGVVTKADLETAICDDLIFAGTDCRRNLVIDLIPIASLRNQPQTNMNCRNIDTTLQPAVNYDPGRANEFIFMRACYMHELYVPGIGLAFDAQANSENRIPLISSSAFVNEPFSN